MKYNEWYDKYIKNNPEQLKYEKMNKNRSKDMEQYQLYKDVLGNKTCLKILLYFKNLSIMISKNGKFKTILFITY